MSSEFKIDKDAAERALETIRGDEAPPFWEDYTHALSESEGLGIGLERILQKVHAMLQMTTGLNPLWIVESVDRAIGAVTIAIWFVRGGTLPRIEEEAYEAYESVFQAPDREVIFDRRVELGWARLEEVTKDSGFDLAQEMRNFLDERVRQALESMGRVPEEQIESFVGELELAIGIALHLLFHVLDKDPGVEPEVDSSDE